MNENITILNFLVLVLNKGMNENIIIALFTKGTHLKGISMFRGSQTERLGKNRSATR